MFMSWQFAMGFLRAAWSWDTNPEEDDEPAEPREQISLGFCGHNERAVNLGFSDDEDDEDE